MKERRRMAARNFKITGPGVLQVNSLDLMQSERTQEQMRALKDLHTFTQTSRKSKKTDAA